MFMRKKKTARGTTIYALVENRRIDGKVKQHVIAHLGQSPSLVAAVYRHTQGAEWAMGRAQKKPSRRWQRRRFLEWDCDWPKLMRAGYADAEGFTEREWERRTAPHRATAERHLQAAKKLEAFAKQSMTDEQWQTALDEYRLQERKRMEELLRPFLEIERKIGCASGIKSVSSYGFKGTTERSDHKVSHGLKPEGTTQASNVVASSSQQVCAPVGTTASA